MSVKEVHNRIYNDEDGNLYEGEMFNEKKHGSGKQIFSNGNFYEG
jgi:hypothetical protein